MYTCSRCDFSYTLKHTQTYSLRGRSQRILESTTVEEYSYVYTGGNLMQMVLKTTTTQAGGTATTTTETLNFTYDASGTPMSVNYDGTNYYYVANIQGDIMAILNTSGEAVVEYTYDAWGKLLSTTGTLADTLGEANPLTYRGYVYDQDSGYYYLQSRYYDPETGRFINADAFASTGQGLLGYNMYTYCENNPVTGYDPQGMANWTGVFAGLGIAVIGVCAIAATVISAGAAAPLVAAAVSSVGVAVGTSVAATGVVVTYGAATEQPIVVDVAVVDGSTHDKTGYSVVIDFDSDKASFDTYYHYGKTRSGYGFSYGVGMVDKYSGSGGYGGYFIDGGITYSHNGIDYGIDVCTDPSDPFNKCSAALFVCSVAFPNTPSGKFSWYLGMDYYQQVSYWEW